MQRSTFFLYGLFCYLLFFATYAYMAGFVGNFLVPKSIDSAPAPTLLAITINFSLISLFALQHSVMARPWFKQIWTQLIPQAIERSTYVLFSCIVTILLMWQWRGLGTIVWNIQHPLARNLLWILFAAGWLMVPTVSLMINHSDLFGIRQVWLYMRGRPYTSLPFRTPYFYNHIRHPLYVGFALAFWATPTMTLGHLFFAATLTLYMAIAVPLEERDLITHFGEAYRAYKRRVPKFIPRFGKNDEPPASVPTDRDFVSSKIHAN